MLKKIALVACAAASTACVQPAAAFDNMNFRDFALTAFGSLAFVGTSPESPGKTQRQMLGHCETLDKGKVQYFVINHYKPEREGQTGYFLVEILLLKKASDDQPSQLRGVELYRSPNWFDHGDEFDTTELNRDDAQAFFDLHDPQKNPEGLAGIPARYKAWHAMAYQGGRSSFDLSRPDIRPEKNQKGSQFYKYRLIKSDLTASTFSRYPVYFFFQSGDADSALVRLTAPDKFSLEPAVYELRFGTVGTPCQAAASADYERAFREARDAERGVAQAPSTRRHN